MAKIYSLLTSSHDAKTRYRIKVDVPTTIFEPRYAIVSVYKGRGNGRKIKEVGVRLENMPYVNIEQAIRLERADDIRVRRKVSKLLKRLER